MEIINTPAFGGIELPRELRGELQWINYFKTNVDSFSGNRVNAGRIISALNEGFEYTMGNLYMLDIFVAKQPQIIIAPENYPGKALMFTSGNGSNVFVRMNYLEIMSSLDAEVSEQEIHLDGSVFFEGKLLDMFRLAGVEESHHAVFNQNFSRSGPKYSDSFDINLSEYDSQNEEFFALEWQIRYAKEKRLPVETLNVLVDRYSKAQKIRDSLVKNAAPDY